MTIPLTHRGHTLTNRTIHPPGLLAGTLQAAGRSLIRRTVENLEHGGVVITDPKGSIRSPLATSAHPRVTVHDSAFYAAAAFGGSIGVAESYMDGQWTCDDLPGLIEIITTNVQAMTALEGPLVALAAPFSRAAYWLERNTRRGSVRNIHAHYDLGNDFFSLFLDESMTYSSGVFDTGRDSLGQAQFNKIDRACRSLDLRSDDHLLEIGTGWGALAVHAAGKYGCKVTTTTISEQQFQAARTRIDAAGLSNRITLVKQDYRDLRGTYSKLVSIEMVEAVGRTNIPKFFQVVSDRLTPDGAAFIQAIVIRDQSFASAARTRDFLKKYIFPGSCLLSNDAITSALAKQTDLRMWGMTDIGDDYVRTLELWSEAFERRLDEVRALGFDERFIRMWRFYFAYCQGAFRARHCGDVQTLLIKPRCRLPRFDAALRQSAQRNSRHPDNALPASERTPAWQGSPA